MLTLTDNCASIVKKLADQPEATGIRISHDEGSAASFALTAVATPVPGDHVLEQDGATVYLDDEAATALDDKVLDAGVDASGNLRFAVTP